LIFRWKIAIFFEMLPKFSDFVNSDDWIGKIKSDLIPLVNQIQIFSNEKMLNSGNCVYDYPHSFFREDFLIESAILVLHSN